MAPCSKGDTELEKQQALCLRFHEAPELTASSWKHCNYCHFSKVAGWSRNGFFCPKLGRERSQVSIWNKEWIQTTP